MVNEALQWAVLGMVLLLMLGLYRQLGVLLDAESPSLDRANGPPLRKRLSAALVDRLQREGVLGGSQSTVFYFVSEGCPRCNLLLAKLGDHDTTVSRTHGGPGHVLITRNASPTFRRSLEREFDDSELRIIHDDGELWDEFGVTVTPFILEINARGSAIAKGVEHDIGKVLARSPGGF